MRVTQAPCFVCGEEVDVCMDDDDVLDTSAMDRHLDVHQPDDDDVWEPWVVTLLHGHAHREDDPTDMKPLVYLRLYLTGRVVDVVVDLTTARHLADQLPAAIADAKRTTAHGCDHEV